MGRGPLGGHVVKKEGSGSTMNIVSLFLSFLQQQQLKCNESIVWINAQGKKTPASEKTAGTEDETLKSNRKRCLCFLQIKK